MVVHLTNVCRNDISVLIPGGFAAFSSTTRSQGDDHHQLTTLRALRLVPAWSRQFDAHKATQESDVILQPSPRIIVGRTDVRPEQRASDKYVDKDRLRPIPRER